MTTTISRRRFLGAVGATVLSARAAATVRSAEPVPDNIHVGMALQGSTAADLQEQAKRIAAVGFDTVQLTFFFHPTVDELKGLSETLAKLKLRVAAFGTYFNLFRPDDTRFMNSSQASMKLLAAHADLFDCRQFVTWSGSYAAQFAGADPRNHSAEAVVQLQKAIREVLLPLVGPINGRVAFEPYYPHLVGRIELAKEALAPFPANQIGMVIDPPNFISPDLYPQRKSEMERLFRELGDRAQLVHFKDLQLNPSGKSVDLPGPGGGEMDYAQFIAEIRGLKRPLDCIIEHIKAEHDVMAKAKAWVDAQLRRR